MHRAKQITERPEQSLSLHDLPVSVIACVRLPGAGVHLRASKSNAGIPCISPVISATIDAYLSRSTMMHKPLRIVADKFLLVHPMDRLSNLKVMTGLLIYLLMTGMYLLALR